MFGEKVIILGDFNLPAKIPTRGSKWRELHLEKTYPSWEPKIKFDDGLAELVKNYNRV